MANTATAGAEVREGFGEITGRHLRRQRAFAAHALGSPLAGPQIIVGYGYAGRLPLAALNTRRAAAGYSSTEWTQVNANIPSALMTHISRKPNRGDGGTAIVTIEHDEKPR